MTDRKRPTSDAERKADAANRQAAEVVLSKPELEGSGLWMWAKRVMGKEAERAD